MLTKDDQAICEDCLGEILDNISISLDVLNLNKESKWLIRTGGRVLGPYTKIQIRDGLLQKQIVPLDEVTKPLESWDYLRNHPEFTEILKEVASRSIPQREDTMTETSATLTGTDTESSETLSLTPISGKDPEKSFSNRSAPNNRSTSQLKQYGTDLGESSRQRLTLFSRRLWVLALLFSLLIALAIFYFMTRKQKTKWSDLSYEDAIHLAYKEKRLGNYGDALQYYLHGDALKPKQTEIDLEFLPLLLNQTRDTTKVRRTLDTVFATKFRPAYVRTAHNHMGLTLLMDEDSEGAITHFRKSLEIDSNYYPALCNLGATYISLAMYKEAEEILTRVLAAHVTDSIPTLLLAKAYIGLYLRERKVVHLEKMDQLLSQREIYLSDHFQEANLLQAYVQFLRGNTQRVIFHTDTLLDSDPKRTALHLQDPALFTGPLEWSSLLSECKRIFDGHPTNPRIKALYGYCLFRSQSVLEGQKMIQEAISQTPEDPLLQALSAYMSLELNQESETLRAVSLALKSNRYQLPLIVMARQCVRMEESDCAYRNWKKLFELSPQSLEAANGIFEIDFQSGNRSGLLARVEKGLKISPTYIPYLRLKEYLLAEGGDLRHE